VNKVSKTLTGESRNNTEDKYEQYEAAVLS
jgi:hypothetical protein